MNVVDVRDEHPTNSEFTIRNFHYTIGFKLIYIVDSVKISLRIKNYIDQDEFECH